MDFQGLELNSREAARRPLPFDILKRATRCCAKKQKTVTHTDEDHIYIFICRFDQICVLNKVRYHHDIITISYHDRSNVRR